MALERFDKLKEETVVKDKEIQKLSVKVSMLQ